MTLYYFYKICSLDNKYIYIGSTTNFKTRMSDHKCNCNNINSKKYNYKLYTTIRQNGGINNFIFEIIDSIDTDDRQTVLKHEQSLIVEYNSNLNTYKAFITNEEKKQYNKQYRIDNTEQINQYNNQYRVDNKEIINNKKKEKFTCACNGRYTRTHKAEHLKSKKHTQYEKQNNITNNVTNNNITNNYNITNLTIQK